MSITEGEVDPSPDAIVTGIGMNVSLSTGSVIIGTATVDLTGIGLDIGLGTATGEANYTCRYHRNRIRYSSRFSFRTSTC
jgi:hypothetical protein